MAKYGKSLAQVTVEINGQQQVQQVLKAMEASAEKLKKEIDAINAELVELAKGGASPEYTAKSNQLKQKQAELNQLKRSMNENHKLNVDLNSILDDMSKHTATTLAKTRRSIEAVLRGMKPVGEKEKQAMRDMQRDLKMLSDEIDRRKGKLVEFEDIMKNLGKASPKDLEAVRHRLESLIATTELGTAELKKYQDQLKRIAEEEQSRKAVQADQVMGNLQGSSVEQIREAIKLTEQLRDSHARGSKDWENYNAQIENATAHLQKYETESKKAAALDVANNLDIASTNEMKQAIEFLTKYRDTLSTTDDEYKDIQAAIDRTSESLKEFNSSTRMEAMETKFASLGKLSVSALAEQKKYWQEVYDSAQKGTAEYTNAEKKLADIKALEQGRTKADATKFISDATAGNFDKTIEETQQAIKLIEEYKKQLKTKTDADAIEEANKAIEILNGNLGKTKESLMDYNEALQKVQDAGAGNFDGTAEELEKAKKSLEAFRKTLKMKTDEKTIKAIDEALQGVSSNARTAAASTVNLDKVLGDLRSSSMEDLQAAAKRLQEELEAATRGTAEYITTAAKLREVNLELKKAKKEWEGQENVIARTAKRLASYVAVYGGYNFIAGKVREVAQANLQFSDSLADIQKTTGLSAEAVGRLSDQINAIDTRTAQKELHDLAYEAGKLGISAEEDVMAFVKAGNQLLVALGEDLGGAEAVRSLMKVNAILGETEKLGVEKALLSTGSAINEISQTSRASAGPIADMVSRMGAIGSAAGLSMADLIALAGTADSLGQSAEVAATAFNKFTATLTSNPVDVAFALGLDPDRLQEQLDSGQTMTAIQEIFAKMSQMGNMADLAPIMGELGSEGARMTQVLVTMAKSVGELNAQVFTSNKAFREATSVTNEYNIKNESAAAIVERMSNNFREMVVQSGFVSWLKEVLQWLYYLPQELEKGWFWMMTLRTVMWEIATISGVRFLKLIGTSLTSAFKLLTQSIEMTVKAHARLKWGQAADAMLATAGAATKLNLVLKALWVTMLKNPFTALAAVAGLAIAAFQTFRKEAKLVDTAVTEMNTAIQNEQAELGRLRRKIGEANSATGERASLIKQLNEKYGSYLGFLVTESNYVEQQAYIYDLLNAKIRENVALKMEEKMMDDIVQEHSKDKMDANKKIQTSLQSLEAIGESKAPDVMENIFAEIARQVEAGEEDVEKVMKIAVGDLGRELQNEMNTLSDQVNSGLITGAQYAAKMKKPQEQGDYLASLRAGVKELLKTEKSISKDIDNAQQIIDRQQKTSKKRAMDITKEYLEDQLQSLKPDAFVEQLQTLQTQANNYIKQQKESVAGLVEKKKALQGLNYNEEEHYRNLTKQLWGTEDDTNKLGAAINESVRNSKALYEQWKRLHDKKYATVQLEKEEEEKIAAVTAEVKRTEEALKPINKRLVEMNGINIWGSMDEENLAKNSPDMLVKMWDKLEADARRLSDTSFKTIGEWQEKNGQLMATQFWKNFDTREQAVSWYKQQKDAIAAQLKKLGYSTSGNFLTDSGDGDQKSKARQYYKSAMDALEAYYKEYEDFIRQKRADNQITEEDMNRQILDNDRKLNEDRQQLIKKFLGEKSTFDKSVYKGVQSGYEYFADKNLDEWAAYYQANGDALEDGARKQIAKSGLEISKALNKEQEKIKKELLKGDVFATFENNFAEMLDEIGALTSKLEEDANRKENEKNRKSGGFDLFGLSPEEREKRISELVKFSDMAYKVDAAGLKKIMLERGKASEWVKSMNDEEMQVLLEKLRWYYDERLSVTKRYQEKLQKEFEMYYQKTGQQATYEKGKAEAKQESQRLEDLEGIGVSPNYGQKRQNVSDAYGVENKRLVDEIASYEEKREAIRKKLLDTLYKKGTNSEEYQALYGEYQAIGQQIVDTELKRNELLAQGQRDLTQVYMDEWTKRAEKWGQVGEMFGDFLGEQLMLEKQANDARARGDEETAKKIEQQQKQNKNALLQNLMNFIVDEAALWAKEYALKMMFNAMSLSEEKKKAIEEATLQGKSSMLSIFLSALTGQASEAKKGLPGLITGAVVFAATMALQAMAKSAISNMFPEAAVGSTSSRKLSTGMLTYADGNYPVLGNDGKVYDAKYEGAGMKTGVYGGGAHFGIFSEKQPEMIVDGKTTQKIILNYPYIYDAITTIAKNGRLKNAMPTFAAGDYPAGMKQLSKAVAVDGGASSNDDMIQMRAALEQNTAAFTQLSKLLQGGITAHLDGLETHRQQKKNERFLKRRGID